jgi:2'-5' RNA ligase
MQHAIGHRAKLILFLAVLGAFSFSASARALGDSCPDSLKPERKLESFEEYPFYKGEKVQVMELNPEDPSQPVWAGGVATAMKHVGPEVAASKPVIDRVVGPSTDVFDIAVGLNGSAARYALFGSANDLDILAQLVLKVKSGSTNELFDAHSKPIQMVTRYLQEHVEQVLKDNPSYRFIELKAGEYLDPETGEKAGIKWWLDDFRRGYKVVHEAKGPRRVTLSQAIAEPARIKIDWAVPSPLDSLNAYDYTEVTTIYILGMKVGNNQPRLRISDVPGANESLVVKATGINLSKEDLRKSIELSVGEHPVTLEHVHQGLIKTIEKYADHDRLKVLKRVFALLSFWENPVDFKILTGIPVEAEVIHKQVQEVLALEKIRVYSRIRSRADVRVIAREHGVELGSRDEEWIRAVKQEFGLNSNTIEAIDEEVKNLIEQELTLAFQKYPHIPEYIEFVRARAPYVVGQELSPHGVFLALKPDEKFRSILAKRIEGWKKKYPALDFVDPSDSHLTIHFSGRMSDPALDSWIAEAKKSSGHVPSAKQGGLYIMGRQNQLVAMKFPSSPEFSSLAKSMRAFSTKVGGTPEKTYLDFTPHITIASIKGKDSPAVQAQVRQFLAESTGALSDVSFEGFEIWTRKSEGVVSDAAASNGKYSKIR